MVLAVHLPKSRSYMHLDTVITMCDRDLVTLFPQRGGRGAHLGESARATPPSGLVVEEQVNWTLPEVMARRPGRLGTMRVVETGGDSFEAEREQWDDGNNVRRARTRRRRRATSATPARTPRCARPASR